MDTFSNPDHDDLAKMRSVAGLTIPELADRINAFGLQGRDGSPRKVTAAQLTTAEAEPEDVPQWLREAWMRGCGYNAEAEGLKPKALYDPLTALRRKSLAKLARWPNEGFNDETRRAHYDSNGLARRISAGLRKPRLALSGGFDAAKSHIGNQLMGAALLPSNFAPETKAITIIMHVDDRPPWCGDDIAMFDEGFVLDQLYNERHYKNHLTISGPLELLQKYATHQKKRPSSNGITKFVSKRFSQFEGLLPPKSDARDPEDTFYAVVFSDAPLLKAVTLIDPPGFAAGIIEDTTRAHWIADNSDVILFLSKFAGFLDDKDFGMLAEILRKLPVFGKEDHPQANSLCNLFVVATHAAQPEVVRQGVLETGADRLWRQFERPAGNLFDERAAVVGERGSIELLQSRFVAYWSNWPETREPLHQSLLRLLNTILPASFLKRSYAHVDTTVSESRQHYLHRINQLQENLHDTARRKQAYLDAQSASAEFAVTFLNCHTDFQHSLKQERKAAIAAALEVVSRYTDADVIYDLITKRFEDDSQSNVEEQAMGYILEALRADLEADAKPRLEKVQKNLDRLVIEMTNQLVQLDPGIDSSSIDLTGNGGNWVAVGALVGGGLGLYFGIFASTWLLGPIGALIGGVGALILWGIHQARWRHDLAKNIAEKLRSESLSDKVTQSVETFWDQVFESTREVFAKVEDEQRAVMARLKAEAEKTPAQAEADYRAEQTFLEARLKDLAELEEVLDEAKASPFQL